MVLAGTTSAPPSFLCQLLGHANPQYAGQRPVAAVLRNTSQSLLHMAPLAHERTLMRAVNTNASPFRRAPFGPADLARDGWRDRQYIRRYALRYVLGGRLVERRRDVQLPSEAQPPSTGRATPFM